MTHQLEHLPDPRKILAEQNRGARKSLGQNFLVNRGVLEKIALCLSQSPRSWVVEVGPGLGHLTFLLCQTHAQVVAVEKDEALTRPLWERLQTYRNRVHLHRGDVMEVDIEAMIPEGVSGYEVVGNLPFYCSTQILFHFLENAPRVEKIVFMFQKEVARRLLASPSSKAYGALTVSCAAQATVRSLFKVSAGSFYPRPEVSAEVLEILPKKFTERLDGGSLEALRRLLRVSFSGRRKKLKNALRKGGLWDELVSGGGEEVERLAALRPDALSPGEYLSLVSFLKPGCRNVERS